MKNNLLEGHELKDKVASLFERIEAISEDEWKVSIDKEDESIIISLSETNREIEFIVLKDSIVWLRMDKDIYPPVCKAGAMLTDEILIHSFEWLKRKV